MNNFFVPLSTFFGMPFPFARFFPACFLAIAKARMRGKPFPAYSAWPFVTLPIISHRFLLLLAQKR